MTANALSVEEITNGFTTNPLPPVTGEPTYESLKVLIKRLYGNAVSVKTPAGGGRHGHLGMLMDTRLYATISATPWTAPTDPGISPAFVQGRFYDEATKEAIRSDFKERKRLYHNYLNMDTALKNQITKAIDDVYLDELNNPYTGYMQLTAKNILDWLLQRYGKISAADLQDNKTRFNEPIDTSQPVSVYFKKMDEAVQFASDGNTPFNDNDIVETAYFAFQQTGLYLLPCKEWRRRPDNQKTWLNFKQFFANEYHDLKEDQRVQTGQTRYHTANNMTHMQDIGIALDNLALSATNDHRLMEQLIANNATLTKNNQELSNHLKAALQAIESIKDDQDKQEAKRVERIKRYEAKIDPNGYCHTHGYKVVKGHNSRTCTHKGPQHKDDATRDNIMGGSTKNKDWSPME